MDPEGGRSVPALPPGITVRHTASPAFRHPSRGAPASSVAPARRLSRHKPLPRGNGKAYNLHSPVGQRFSSTGLIRRALTLLGAGAHVRVVGKGCKERCTPLAKSTRAVLQAWLREPSRDDGSVLFPSATGNRLSIHGVQYLLSKLRRAAATKCPSLRDKRVTVHRLRHTMAMDLLQAGVERSVIALWLGHESVETTQIYLEATLAMKEAALAKTAPPHGRLMRYQPGDQLLGFLKSL